MNFKSKDYLLNSEVRIEKLRKIIDGRPVAILAAGPSITELENRISEFSNADICYFGLNNFLVQEEHILQQINRHMSVVMCSAPHAIHDGLKANFSFLNRDEDNMFISSLCDDNFGLMDASFSLNQFLDDYDRKLLFFSCGIERTIPNSNYPLHFIIGNSLQILIQLALIGKAASIVLFGADGHCEENAKENYYRQNEYEPQRGHMAGWYINNDTKLYFNPITSIAIRNTYKNYDLVPIDILNCSENSFYTPFPKVSYDDAFDYLLRCKKFQREMDLRVPNVSVIILCTDSRKFMKETVENVLKQSYSNYEHIIVANEAYDKIRDLERQFPLARWIPEKNIEHLRAFKRGISIARGEYIFYCHNGNGYLNHDWFNTCVEVLENNPDVSLVWGLSQCLLENGAVGQITNAHFFDNPPSQKKFFIYYWLKKKILFHEGNFCVRKKVLEECFPFLNSNEDERKAWIVFNYRFNTLGYLPYFIPIVANYFRGQNDIMERRQIADPDMQNWMQAYYKDIEQYKRKLIWRRIAHHYRNSSGKLLLGGFSCSIFLFFNVGRYISTKLPESYLLVIERAYNYLETYRWKFLVVVTAKFWHRLIKILTK